MTANKINISSSSSSQAYPEETNKEQANKTTGCSRFFDCKISWLPSWSFSFSSFFSKEENSEMSQSTSESKTSSFLESISNIFSSWKLPNWSLFSPETAVKFENVADVTQSVATADIEEKAEGIKVEKSI